MKLKQGIELEPHYIQNVLTDVISNVQRRSDVASGIHNNTWAFGKTLDMVTEVKSLVQGDTTER